MEMARQASSSDNDRSSGELPALDCNLASLCGHIQVEGFSNGSFSDVVVRAFGSTYHLHRLILSRSSYFRNMLQSPWKEANASVLTLHVDDTNVNGEAVAIALAYLYGHLPKLNDGNAFRVLAAASFLDLQDLCAICTDFIISELWTSNFLAYQVFAESQDYGIHGERVRNACWGYLCQSGAMELKEVLPKLSCQTLHALLTSDKLWILSEEKRFELALYTVLSKGALCAEEHSEEANSSTDFGTSNHSNLKVVGKNLMDGSSITMLESEIGHLNLKDEVECCSTAHNILVELVDCVVDSYPGFPCSEMLENTLSFDLDLQPTHNCNVDGPSSTSSFSCINDIRASGSCIEMSTEVGQRGLGSDSLATEGPSEEISCYQLNNSIWPGGDQRNFTSLNSSCNNIMASGWGRCGTAMSSWGGRVVGQREVKKFAEGHCGLNEEDYLTFVNIFEGGSLLYCNMSFEVLLSVRKQLEELGFPCKAVNDGLWLQMLLSQRVQEIGADTCKNCCHVSVACTCRQQFSYSRGVASTGNYVHEHQHVRINVTGTADGLAGIGRGNNFASAAAWPPTRLVFTRVPMGMGNRNCQLSLGNDDPGNQLDNNTDVSAGGLTALVGLSQGGSNIAGVHEQVERGYETNLPGRLTGPSASRPSTRGVPVEMLSCCENVSETEWENRNSSISLDMQTPLSHFPPFRFGVEFQDVHRLCDGQVKHSREVFYAGSLWKVSVQAFNDEDPQGRRTLGLFLHRRKADITDSTKVHMFIDSREKVTARYQLICPSKRDVLVFGSYKQTGTLLPKAPKGWGWRTALLFDELGDLLHNGALRVAAVVQLV